MNICVEKPSPEKHIATGLCMDYIGLSVMIGDDLDHELAIEHSKLFHKFLLFLGFDTFSL